MPPVAVVGAGLAGLHAAWRLHAAGRDVVVLEARDRVGGRPRAHPVRDRAGVERRGGAVVVLGARAGVGGRRWSHGFGAGAVVERGGEFIAPTDDALRGLCAELGLPLVPHGFPFDRRPTPERPAPTEAELAAVTAGW